MNLKSLRKLFLVLGWRKIYPTEEIFTPGETAVKSFVERKNIGRRFEFSLKTRGKQIVVYGKSGSGKSTLVNVKVPEFFPKEVRIVCTNDFTFKKILDHSFDQMNIFVASGNSVEEGSSIGAEFSGKRGLFGALAKISQSKAIKREHERIVIPQANINVLAQYIRKRKACWIIEDFHELEVDVKKKIARSLKVLSDFRAKMIVIGIVGNANEVLLYNTELDNNRLSEFYVPLMNEQELLQIIAKGEELLNVKFEENCKKIIVKLSNGYAGVCHQLCLNLCWTKDVMKTSHRQVLLEFKDLSKAVELYISDKSDSLKKAFEKAFAPRDEELVNYREEILLSYFRLGNDSLNLKQLKRQFRTNIDDYSEETLIKEIDFLVRREILARNELRGVYAITDPLFHAYCYLLVRDKIDSHRNSILRQDVNEFADLNLNSLHLLSDISLSQILPSLMQESRR